MIIINRKYHKISRTLDAVVTALIIAILSPTTFADGWELRTVSDEVPGTRAIESGHAEKAIRVSKARLSVTPESRKVAVLTNLCIGYLTIGDLEQADKYCERAVSRPTHRAVTYNNRGVLRIMQGDYQRAVQDFSTAATAGCNNGCDATITVPRDLPRPVARRNLAKAEKKMLAAELIKNRDQQAARAEP